MAFQKIKSLLLLFCVTFLVGAVAHGKAAQDQKTSLLIGIFNSIERTQGFFESTPAQLREGLELKQLWVNAYQTPSGLMEHNLEISGITATQSAAFCKYASTQAMQCVIANKAVLPLSSFVPTTVDQSKQYASVKPVRENVRAYYPILKPLGMQLTNDNHHEGMDLSFKKASPENNYEQKVKSYAEDFTLTSSVDDSLEAQAAKAAYNAARGKFISAVRNVGDGVNAGNGSEAARQELISLGRELFETAGSVYLSGFLEREVGQGEALPEDAGAGKAFIHHVQNNIGNNARSTVEDLVSELLSSATGAGEIGNDVLKTTTDRFILSGAQGLIDAGLAAARRSDLYALRNMELEYNLNNFENSYLSALITQPIYQTDDLRHNVFLQGGGIVNEQSVDIDDDVARHTLNVGAAYRYLSEDEKYLLGANMFFDHQWPYNHSRMSVGVDAKAQDLSLAANYYYPLTDYRDSRIDSSGNQYEERALEGYDVEIGYNLPHLRDMTLFGKGYQYFRETDDDIRGLELSAEYNIRDNFAIEGAFIEENGGRDGAEISLKYRVPLYNVDKPNLALAAMEPATGTDSMRGKIFEKVRRENRIRVEERLKTDNTATIITAQFNALSVGLPFLVGGAATGAGVNLPFDTAITVPNGDFGIINFSNGAIANVSASGGGDVILEFNNSTLTVTATNGGFVQFISGGGGISTVNVPGGTVNLLGTDIDVTDDGTTTTVQVRAGAINVVPDVGVAALGGAQADVVSLTIASGATSLLVNPALETRQEAAFTNLDLTNPDPPTDASAAPFINVLPALITGPQFVGNNADIRLTFTQPVTVGGAPFLNGLVDANARTFAYNAGASTPTQLVFRHVYVAGDVGAAAITIQDLDLNGGSIIGTTNTLNAITAYTDTVVPINDLTAPMLIGSTPADNEPAFNSGTDIVLNFDENIQANIGNITLTDVTDGSSSTIIPIGDPQVTIAGSTVTINPTGILDLTTDYDLVIGANVVQDTAGNAFAGIASGDLNFTTSNDVTPPTFAPATDASPADNDVDVVLSENIIITFSEAVNKNVGNIEIRRTADNVLVETIDVTTGLVTGGGTNTITINPASDFPLATDVYILIDAGAFEDLVGNPYAGIASTTAFNFRSFQPVDVPGILLWLDAHDLDGDGATEGAAEAGLSGGDAATWVDKSGNNNDIAHGTASRRPTLSIAGKNGRDILNFDGNDALFATDASVPTLDLNNNEFTLVAVINPTNTNGRIIINKETSYEIGLNSGRVQAAVVTTAPGSWNWGGTANNAITTAWHNVEFAHNNTMWDFYQDGALTETIVPANNQTGNISPTNNIFTVGGRGTAAPTSSFFIGDMAEVLIFDHALTLQERTDLNAYLTDKWGL